MDGKMRGFTLIELLIVIIVVSLMATMATIYVREYRISSSLKEAVNKITTDLGYIKSLSVSTDDIWVLCFIDEDGDSEYEAYRIIGDKGGDMSINLDDCTATGPDDHIKEKVNLPVNVHLDISPDTAVLIGFAKRGITLINSGGDYANFGVRFTVTSKIDPTRKRIITVNTAGRVYSQ